MTSIKVGDKVALKNRPYITGKATNVTGQIVTVTYDGELMPPYEHHFQDDLIILEVDSTPATWYIYTKTVCECGLDSLYGEEHSYGHSDYCPKGDK